MASSVVIFALCLIIPLTVCRPSDEDGDEVTEDQESSSSTPVVPGGYLVSLRENQVDGKCVANLTLVGPGSINKQEEYPCPDAPPTVISLDGALLVSGRYFTDTPGELVHLADGKCENEAFTDNDGVITSEVKPMEEAECDKVKEKVELLEKQNQDWNDWLASVQQEAQQQLLQVQQSLQALQHQIFSRLFGGAK